MNENVVTDAQAIRSPSHLSIVLYHHHVQVLYVGFILPK